MNIMLRLENIQRKGSIISARVITVENNPQTFLIQVDVKERKLVSHTHDKVDSYVGMAMAKLIRVSEEYGNRLPKKEEAVWY